MDLGLRRNLFDRELRSWTSFLEKLDLSQRGQAHDRIIWNLDPGVASQLNLPFPIMTKYKARIRAPVVKMVWVLKFLRNLNSFFDPSSTETWTQLKSFKGNFRVGPYPLRFAAYVGQPLAHCCFARDSWAFVQNEFGLMFCLPEKVDSFLQESFGWPLLEDKGRVAAKALFVVVLQPQEILLYLQFIFYY